ncbi:MAG: hypothetical protein HOL56_03925 [Flavobacteriales bacterium]|nr:hypothetical protein [Flavobacteriales bacterium]MBT5354226.1 hypothetical protein [Flavobacteriales bacterium]
MKSYLQHKADFPHKLGIKFYMISLTLLLVKQFPNLTEAPWWIYLSILVLSYSYCLKRVIAKK